MSWFCVPQFERGRDKDGEVKSERALSSKTGCYKEQDSGQVVPFAVDQGLIHETSVIIDNVSGQVRGASQLEIDHALIHWAKSRTLPVTVVESRVLKRGGIFCNSNASSSCLWIT